MRASPSGGRPLLVFAALAALTLALDQATKALAISRLGAGPLPFLGGMLQLNLTRNTGSAFGLPTPAWAAVAVSIAVCVVVLMCVARGAVQTRLRAAALGLVVGGALGNLVDRTRAGAVVDFIDLRVWPVFNVADIAITVGVGLMILDLLGAGRRAPDSL